MVFAKRLFIFLVISFSALYLGSFFTGPGVASEWYQSANQAPWTPPGWVFGVAWTSIMILYSLYWTYLWPTQSNKKKLALLLAAQIALNVIWNPVFFHFHATASALFFISALLLSIVYMARTFKNVLELKTLLLAPYMIWLLIAISLNAYIVVYN